MCRDCVVKYLILVFLFSVYFQLLDKNITDDERTVYEIMKARNSSIFGKENKTYEISRNFPETDFNLTQETPTFDEYEPESTPKPSEDIQNNYDDINVFEDYKDGHKIIRVTMEIPFDGYEPELNDYSSINAQNTTKNWLSVIGIFFFIIAGICAIYRKCSNRRSGAENSSEDVTTAFIVVIPKPGKVPKSTDP